jgi:hypothetical protein
MTYPAVPSIPTLAQPSGCVVPDPCACLVAGKPTAVQAVVSGLPDSCAGNNGTYNWSSFSSGCTWIFYDSFFDWSVSLTYNGTDWIMGIANLNLPGGVNTGVCTTATWACTDGQLSGTFSLSYSDTGLRCNGSVFTITVVVS